MQIKLIVALFSCAMILITHGCCSKADCIGSGGNVELRLLKNGEVATGGPGSLIDPQLISYYPDGHDFLTNPAFFSADSQSINFFLDDEQDYILILDDYGIDTISVTSEFVSKGSCDCHTYKITSIIYNGQVLCTDACEEVIDVEI